MKIQSMANDREGYLCVQSEDHGISNHQSKSTYKKSVGHYKNFVVQNMSDINSDIIKEVRTKESNKNNTLIRLVQYTKQPMKAFKHILVDGEYRYFYEDHIHFLTKKRQRIAGK